MTRQYVTASDEEVLDALFTTPTRSAAAEKLGMSRSGLYRRMKEPEIASAFHEWRLECMAEAGSSMHEETIAAVRTLAKIHRDPGAPPSVRVQAANSLIQASLKLRETEELEARVAELEERFG